MQITTKDYRACRGNTYNAYNGYNAYNAYNERIRIMGNKWHTSEALQRVRADVEERLLGMGFKCISPQIFIQDPVAIRIQPYKNTITVSVYLNNMREYYTTISTEDSEGGIGELVVAIQNVWGGDIGGDK